MSWWVWLLAVVILYAIITDLARMLAKEMGLPGRPDVFWLVRLLSGPWWVTKELLRRGRDTRQTKTASRNSLGPRVAALETVVLELKKRVAGLEGELEKIREKTSVPSSDC